MVWNVEILRVVKLTILWGFGFHQDLSENSQRSRKGVTFIFDSHNFVEVGLQHSEKAV